MHRSCWIDRKFAKFSLHSPNVKFNFLIFLLTLFGWNTQWERNYFSYCFVLCISAKAENVLVWCYLLQNCIFEEIIIKFFLFLTRIVVLFFYGLSEVFFSCLAATFHTWWWSKVNRLIPLNATIDFIHSTATTRI